MELSLFEKATYLNLRFQFGRGTSGVEHLWKLSLEDLDKLAVEYSTALEKGSKSFLNPSQEDEELRLKFNVVKRILDYKLYQKAQAKLLKEERVARKQEREQLLTLLQEKNKEELKSLSKEEILNRLGKL